MSHLTKHLTFANVASALCLVLVMGAGVAHAAGLAKNSVKSGHIVNGQVKTVDLAPNAVKSGRVAGNTLTGADINEGTLSGVDAETVDGMTMKKINWRMPSPTGRQPILEFPGKFALYGECVFAGDALDLNAATGEDDSQIVVMAGRRTGSDVTVQSSNMFDGLDAGEQFGVDDLAGFIPNITGSMWARIDFSTPSGFTAHVDLDILYFIDDCVVTGTAYSG